MNGFLILKPWHVYLTWTAQSTASDWCEVRLSFLEPRHVYLTWTAQSTASDWCEVRLSYLGTEARVPDLDCPKYSVRLVRSFLILEPRHVYLTWTAQSTASDWCEVRLSYLGTEARIPDLDCLKYNVRLVRSKAFILEPRHVYLTWTAQSTASDWCEVRLSYLGTEARVPDLDCPKYSVRLVRSKAFLSWNRGTLLTWPQIGANKAFIWNRGTCT
ncbi:hypothetical protein J6590_067281 [Homalodisca vitripennis]|nr:hypothetical protein J6590_067281 [Homalodisca vitripennis]